MIKIVIDKRNMLGSIIKLYIIFAGKACDHEKTFIIFRCARF